jgi:hypothetical protein
MHVCTGTTAQLGHARNRYNRSQYESGFRGPVRQMQRQMQPPVAHTYSAEQCDIVRDWVGRSSSSALQSPGTCRHATPGCWLAGWLATACDAVHAQAAHTMAEDTAGGSGLFRLPVVSDVPNATGRRAASTPARAERRTRQLQPRDQGAAAVSSAQPIQPSCNTCMRAQWRTRAQAAANMQGSFVRRRIQSVLQ